MAAGDSDFGAVGGVPDRGYPDVTLDGVREVQGIRFRRVRVQGTRVPLLPKVRSRALAGRIAMFAGTRVPLLPKVRSRALAGLAGRIAMLAGTRVPLLPKVRSRALACRIAMLASLDATRSGAPPPPSDTGGARGGPYPRGVGRARASEGEVEVALSRASGATEDPPWVAVAGAPGGTFTRGIAFLGAAMRSAPVSSRHALEECRRFGAGLFEGRVEHRALLGGLGLGLGPGGLPGLSRALRLGPGLGSAREPGPLRIGSRGDLCRLLGRLCCSTRRFAPVPSAGSRGFRRALRRRRGPGSRAGGSARGGSARGRHAIRAGTWLLRVLAGNRRKQAREGGREEARQVRCESRRGV